jgi:hypothetical protein
LVAVVFAAQIALVFALGERQFPPPRTVTHVPHFTLVDSSSELIALDDPTLFALPHLNDFATAIWPRLPVANQPSFRRAETQAELASPAGESLGADFTRFMRTNQFAAPLLDFRPEPELTEPAMSLPPVFPPNSTLQIEGELAQRKWLNPASLPNWPYADVIAPSRVQVLVDASGVVVQAVLLRPDNPTEVHLDDAEQRALELARSARFAPAPRLTFGRMIFNWRTIPPPATNSPAAPP